jgi:glycosyltransferase involved in cell wall biosynthesis
MRVLHIITSLSTGGAEIMLQKLVGALNPEHYTNNVISLTTTTPVGTELEAAGVRVIGLGGRGGMLTPRQGLQLVRAYNAVRPQVVHAWMYHSNVAAQLLVGLRARKTRPGLILSVRGALHAAREQKLASRLIRRMDAALSSRSDAIVFNSRRAAEQHVALGYDPDKIRVIPNGFDPDRFAILPMERVRIRAELGCDGATLIGLIARFDKLKGHRLFLEAARLVADRGANYRFVLAGRGCDTSNQELSRWIGELGLAARVHLLGERRDIPAIDNALDIAVCSSISESFPNAIGEAMACGVPCVVTDVGDCGYLVGKTGYVVPPRNAQALADAIVRMGELPESDLRALRADARRRVTTVFSMGSVVQQFADLYETYGRR